MIDADLAESNNNSSKGFINSEDNMPTSPHPREYRGDSSWEKESPLKVTTDKIRLCYYPTAAKLQISAG